jgi:ABC-2 type transport system permease protein
VTTTYVADADHPHGPLQNPGRVGGLVDVFRRRFLLRLLVRKEVRARYQNSYVGMAWSYVKPAVRFVMYYWIIGLLLTKALEDRPMHIFSGMIVVSFFTECLSSGTKSVLKNKALVRKINLPREMFPVAAVAVSLYHMIPFYVIAVIGAVISGWQPDPVAPLAAMLALAIVLAWGTAAALILSAWNVFFRDTQNIVEIIQTVITWTVPMIYPFSIVAPKLEGIAGQIYLASPLAISVLLNDRAFWVPGLEDKQTALAEEIPPDIWERGFIALAVGLVLIWVGQMIFSRLEGRFAEHL